MVAEQENHCLCWNYCHFYVVNVDDGDRVIAANIEIKYQKGQRNNDGQKTVTLRLLPATMAMNTFLNHSLHVSTLWLRLDYSGILTLIVGSFFWGIWAGFYCEPLLQNVYWAMIVSLSLLASVLVLHPRLQGQQFRTLRTLAFVGTALSGFVPIGHGLWLYGWKAMWVRSGMPYWLAEGVLYGAGVAFFGTRWPKCTWPGRFDVVGGSHAVFHVAVVCAAVVHLRGVWEVYMWNYLNRRECAVGI
jgi:adiponectin receptor